MSADWDEETLKDIVNDPRIPQAGWESLTDVIEPIKKMRRKENRKFYTVKEWKRFDKIAERENGIDITMQEVLLKRYDVILTDYKTKGEKIKGILNKFNAENLNKGITTFNKGVDQIVKMTAAPKKTAREGKAKSKKKTKKKESFQFGISQKEYESVFGSRKGFL